MEIRFHIVGELVDSLIWEDGETLERAQEGDVKLYKLRPLLSNFVIDENGKPVKHADAMKLIAKVPFKQIPQIVEAFTNALKDGTVPKENGSLSEPLSPASSEDSPSLPGSEQ